MSRRRKKPRPIGKWSHALATLVRRGAARPEPLADVLSLKKRTRDAGLLEVLDAWAHHEPSPRIRIEDWVVEGFFADGERSIGLGTTGGGDPIRAEGPYVFVLDHATGDEERVGFLESFLSGLQFRALDNDRETPLDDVVDG